MLGDDAFAEAVEASRSRWPRPPVSASLLGAGRTTLEFGAVMFVWS